MDAYMGFPWLLSVYVFDPYAAHNLFLCKTLTWKDSSFGSGVRNWNALLFPEQKNMNKCVLK